MINKKENILLSWLRWHFVEMPKFLVQIWKDYLLFASNFFSLEFLLKTFFSPWRKYRWKYPKGFRIVEFLNTFVSNTFSRILGAVMRIILIILGALFQVFVAFSGGLLLLAWLLIPIFIIAGFLFVLFY